MKTRRKLIAVLCMAAAAVAVGANSAASTASAAAKAPTGKAIVVGSICSCSGPQADVLRDQADVSKAWADSVNASGGINGHPVKMITFNDDSNAALALDDAKKLVADHVIAIVGDDSSADAAWAPYIESTGIPVVGGIAPSLEFLTNPDFYGDGASLPVQTIGLFNLAKAAHKSKVGILYCAETPLCAEVIPIAQGGAALTGESLSTLSISSTAPSYTAPCLAMKSDGVNALFVADNAAVTERVLTACAQQGYKPLTITEITTGDTSWLHFKLLDGAQMSSSNANYSDPSLPAVAAYINALKKYVPGLVGSANFAYDEFYPWIAGKLFQAAAKAGKIGPHSTPADVKKGLYKLKNETLGGLTAPLTFVSGQPAFPTCYYDVTIRQHKFISQNKDHEVCMSATETAGLEAGLKKLL